MSSEKKKISYYHQNNVIQQSINLGNDLVIDYSVSNRYTVAYHSLRQDEVGAIINAFYDGADGVDIQFLIGIAKVHSDDQYKKKLGRELATERLDMQLFEVSSVVLHRDNISFFSSNEKYSLFWELPRGRKFAIIKGIEEK